MTEDERDSFIIFKIWSLSKSPFPTISLTNILWGGFILLYPSSPPAVTATMHPPHSSQCPHPVHLLRALSPAKHSPCPPHTSLHSLCPQLASPWGQGPSLALPALQPPCSSCVTVQGPLHGTHTEGTLSTQTSHQAWLLLPIPTLCFSLVLTLFNNSLCLPLPHPKVIIYAVTPIRSGDWQRQTARCQEIYHVLSRVANFSL